MGPTISNFLALLASQVGRGIYVWGGNGEVLTDMRDPAAWIERRETSAENVEKDLALLDKRIRAGVEEIRAFDCSGIVYWALKSLGVLDHDLSSRGLNSESEHIDEKDLRAGDLVFHAQETKEGKQRIVHVGVHVGDGEYIECRGRDVGVVKNKRKNGYWTHFGRWKNLKDDESEPEPQPEPPAPEPPDPTPTPKIYIKVHGSVRVREGNGVLTKKIKTVKNCELPYLGQAPEAPYWYMTQVYKYGVLRDGYITSKPKYTEVIEIAGS